jgi:hypothetical protein
MFPKDHPWYGEEFGAIDFYWYLERGYTLNMFFELDQKPFLDFCRQRKVKANDLLMKISSRLSQKYLPQYVISLSKKVYPARYPAGYVRQIRPERDMIEWVAVREKDDSFAERLIREQMNGWEKFLAVHFPRLTVAIIKRWFGWKEMKHQYALMVSRNPLRELGFPVPFTGTDYRTFLLIIPFGEKVTAVFGAPHAFGNVDYYKGIIGDFKNYIEQPETIPQELIDKRYDAKPRAHELKKEGQKS